MARDPELTKVYRRLTKARRELRKAVERFAEIDPRRGHRVEAVCRAREVRDVANKLVEMLEDPVTN